MDIGPLSRYYVDMCPLSRYCGDICLRVAKFEAKVGSRRTTKIGNLVVLDIFLVALILIPYNGIVGKRKGENKNLKEFLWTTIFQKNSKKYLVVGRTTRSQFLVVLTQFLVVEDTRTREFCYPVSAQYLLCGQILLVPSSLPDKYPDTHGLIYQPLSRQNNLSHIFNFT